MGDTDESDFEDDDITHLSCNVLELCNDAINMGQIWVRVSIYELGPFLQPWQAGYIRIYDFIVEYYNRKMQRHGPAPSIVLIGQPGIGKSLRRGNSTYC